MNLARLRTTWYRRAGVEDIERDTRVGNLLLHEKGSRSQDAQDLAFAGEMEHAALAILDHPALSRRDRAIWRLHCEGRTYAEIVAAVHCSFGEHGGVSSTIKKVKALMLRPNWGVHMRPPKKPAKPNKSEFVDVETTIEMGVKNAHRKIVELTSKPRLDSDDILDNERAVHTLLAARRSELDYLKGKLPAYPPASDDQVRAIIDQETGRHGAKPGKEPSSDGT